MSKLLYKQMCQDGDINRSKFIYHCFVTFSDGNCHRSDIRNTNTIKQGNNFYEDEEDFEEQWESMNNSFTLHLVFND